MSDQNNNGNPPEPTGPDQNEPEAQGQPVSGPEQKTGAGEVRPDPTERLTAISDQLRRALEDAEASVAKKPAATPVSPEDAVEQEIEVEIDPEAEGVDFDPNQVDEIKEPPPTPPSPKEQELKLQILDLRQQLRDKDKEFEQKIKEMKQNVEQARLLQRNFDGYKSRVQREKADWFNYGHEPVMKEILPVIDNFERALAHAGDHETTRPITDGVKMILQQLMSVLVKFGVTPIDMEGQTFNPEVHQAIAQVDNAELPAGSIIEIHQRGYLMKDRLLRPAMVVVSKRPDQKNDTMGPVEPTDQGTDDT